MDRRQLHTHHLFETARTDTMYDNNYGVSQGARRFNFSQQDDGARGGGGNDDALYRPPATRREEASRSNSRTGLFSSFMGRGGQTGAENGANNNESPPNETMRLAPQNRPMNSVAPAAPSAAAGDRNGFLARLEAKQQAEARSVKDLQAENAESQGVNPHLNKNANAYSNKSSTKK